MIGEGETAGGTDVAAAAANAAAVDDSPGATPEAEVKPTENPGPTAPALVLALPVSPKEKRPTPKRTLEKSDSRSTGFHKVTPMWTPTQGLPTHPLGRRE